MKTLTRYICREAFAFFGIALLAFTTVLLTVQMLRLTSLIVNKGVGFFQIAQVFISIIPTFLEIAVPMAALLGVMLAFARLSGDSEVVVMRSSGISLYQLIRPVAFFAAFIISLSLVVSVYLRPWGYSHLNRMLFEIARSRSTAGLDAGIFSKLGSLTLYSEAVDHSTGLLRNVIIDDKRDENGRRLIIAQSGRVLSNEEARTITFHLFDGDIHEIIEGKYIVTRFDANSLSVNSEDLLSGDGNRKSQKAQEMGLGAIRAGIDSFSQKLNLFQRQGGEDPEAFTEIFGTDFRSVPEVARKLNRLHLEAGRRFSIPVASFLLVFLGMPLGVHPPRTQRTWGIGLSSLLGLAVFIVYYGFLSVGMALAEGNRINPYAALWFPNLVVLCFAIIFCRRIASERWSSVAEGVVDFCRRIPARFRSNGAL